MLHEYVTADLVDECMSQLPQVDLKVTFVFVLGRVNQQPHQGRVQGYDESFVRTMVDSIWVRRVRCDAERHWTVQLLVNVHYGKLAESITEEVLLDSPFRVPILTWKKHWGVFSLVRLADRDAYNSHLIYECRVAEYFYGNLDST